MRNRQLALEPYDEAESTVPAEVADGAQARATEGPRRAAVVRDTDIGNLVRPGRVFVGTAAFGKPDEDYSVLRSMAATLPRNT